MPVPDPGASGPAGARSPGSARDAGSRKPLWGKTIVDRHLAALLPVERFSSPNPGTSVHDPGTASLTFRRPRVLGPGDRPPEWPHRPRARCSRRRPPGCCSMAIRASRKPISATAFRCSRRNMPLASTRAASSAMRSIQWTAPRSRRCRPTSTSSCRRSTRSSRPCWRARCRNRRRARPRRRSRPHGRARPWASASCRAGA